MDSVFIERFLRRLASTAAPGMNVSSNWGKRLASWLQKKERCYYDHISRPEITIVLKVHPDLAVQRKSEEEARFVRDRNAAIWEVPWDRKDVYVVDAGRPLAEVVRQIKAIVWAQV